MSYQEINHFNSPNYTPAASVPSAFGYKREVKSITIHWWDAPEKRPTFEGTINWLCTPWQQRPGQVQSSCHAVVEAGRVAWIVDGTDAAWHAGNAYGSATSIGVECNPRASDGDYQTIGELVRDIRKIYGDIPLIPHRYWKETTCPGNYDLARIDAIARGGSVAPAPKPAPAPAKPAAPAPASGSTTIQRSTNEIHWVVEKNDSLSRICQYYYGEASTATVAKVAAYNGIANPNALAVGQRVWIPGPMVWSITAPDTVQSICNYYGVSWQWLAARNPNQVSGPNTELYIGNTLRIL
jgi:N-acetylmuramoyl-L-alanine amidase